MFSEPKRISLHFVGTTITQELKLISFLQNKNYFYALKVLEAMKRGQSVLENPQNGLGFIYQVNSGQINSITVKCASI